MCGIAGFIDAGTNDAHEMRGMLRRMLEKIAYRGPDAEGMWTEGQVAIGHLRLAIVDLSPAGNQPMLSATQRYVLAFNGEIYNHELLRQELLSSGCAFRGRSDTEVLLALIERLGLEAALKRCIGMFAIVLWDRHERILQLARDRFGEKPLYYGWHGGSFVYGSELKALASLPVFQRKISPEAVYAVLRYGYIASPRCIYENTWKLPAGTILTLKLSNGSVASIGAPQSYWSQIDVAENGLDNPFKGSFGDASTALESLLLDAVKLQMQADVPLGAFLSGGIDSSTIVALMQTQSTRRIKTFAIGFDDDALNEAHHAKLVASHLGTDHTELYVGARDAVELIPELPEIFDEPFADPSQIPTYCLAKLARSQVTVSLSGDGGDELFGGYAKYAFGNMVSSLPLRGLWATTVNWLPWSAIERTGSRIGGRFRRLTAERFERLHALLEAADDHGIADAASVINRRSADIFRGRPRTGELFRGLKANPPPLKEYLRLAMTFDRDRYLPDDVLAKVDRATMAVSLESRSPLLDHRIVQFAASLPLSYLVQGQTKRVLRDVLYRHIPRALVDRPKAGFGVPLGKWLGTELHGWAFDLLQKRDHAIEEFIDVDKARALLIEHRRMHRDRSAQLWPILMLQMWAHRYL